jgi:hypothetical protein
MFQLKKKLKVSKFTIFSPESQNLQIKEIWNVNKMFPYKENISFETYH